MRVAVVGATGNTGTAVLKALADAPEVSSVIGIARRMPDAEAEPYAGCEWATIDIAAGSSAGEASRALEAAFAGADAVIHLAWLIQPNSERNLLRRVNVDGTDRVARAAAAAGVRQLVVASSVGAYAPDPDRNLTLERRDESWPVAGVRTSHYSVDKAAQERVLDDFAAAHPEVTVARLRPALVFQEDAASAIQRSFLGAWMPVQLLDSAKPPALPLPRGLHGVQAVHADDLARAYVAAVVQGASGAFNICADDVLSPQDLADIIDHGRYVELPPRLVRALLFGGHKTGLIAADPGWIDMAMAVPIMDNTRAKAQLDWQPHYSAADALRILLRGIIEGQGGESIPLRPLSPKHTDLGNSAKAGPQDRPVDADQPSAQISDRISEQLLGLYLSDHLSGATAGADRAERLAASAIDTPVYARLSETAEEIRLERAFLQQIIDDLGLPRRGYRQAVAWAGEHLGRLKGNGRVLARSPLTLVLEAELMRSAVIGKLGVWQTLGELAEELGLDPEIFAELGARAQQQAAVFGEVHEYARERAFREDRRTFGPEHGADGAAHSAAAARDTDPDLDPAATVPTTQRSDTQQSHTTPDDIAERPGTSQATHQSQEDLVDEWGEESFPASDPPAHY